MIALRSALYLPSTLDKASSSFVLIASISFCALDATLSSLFFAFLTASSYAFVPPNDPSNFFSAAAISASRLSCACLIRVCCCSTLNLASALNASFSALIRA